MKRNVLLANIAINTVDILSTGIYNVGDKEIDISEHIDNCIKYATLYDGTNNAISSSVKNMSLPVYKDCVFDFTFETTMHAADRLSFDENSKVAILNFASAVRPGGSYLSGCNAQEESIARVSALVPSLEKFSEEFYRYHRKCNTPYASNKIIYSPAVPVFKNENGELLDDPYLVDIITSAAVNCSLIPYTPDVADSIRSVMYSRIREIIAVAALNGNDTLVLGAFGCGVFKNSVSQVGELFGLVLRKEGYARYFKHIVFAIYDSSVDTISRFKKSFMGR